MDRIEVNIKKKSRGEKIGNVGNGKLAFDNLSSSWALLYG